jgi:hypothetical protein
MNTTMRARSKHAAWKPVLEGDQAWLRNIPFELDIVQADEKAWITANGDALLSQAIAACIHPGIGLASATKVVHLKRPYLVPILDRLVAEMMGVNLPDNPSVTQRVAVDSDWLRLSGVKGVATSRCSDAFRRNSPQKASSAPSFAFSTASSGTRIRPLAFLAASERSASGFGSERAEVAASCRHSQPQRRLSSQCHQPSRTSGSASITAAPSRARGPRIAADLARRPPTSPIT